MRSKLLTRSPAHASGFVHGIVGDELCAVDVTCRVRDGKDDEIGYLLGRAPARITHALMLDQSDRSLAASSGLSWRLASSRSHLAKRSGVLMKPGITQLTRMLCGASSLASTLENRISADFAGPVQEDRNGGFSAMIPVWPLALTVPPPPSPLLIRTIPCEL